MMTGSNSFVFSLGVNTKNYYRPFHSKSRLEIAYFIRGVKSHEENLNFTFVLPLSRTPIQTEYVTFDPEVTKHQNQTPHNYIFGILESRCMI